VHDFAIEGWLKESDLPILVFVKRHQILPADARLVSGEACLEHSFVSGESEPVLCSAGSHLYAAAWHWASRHQSGSDDEWLLGGALKRPLLFLFQREVG
jgi:hypothetical protein